MKHLQSVPDDVLPAFAIEGQLVGVQHLERGHIHDTFVSTWKAPTGRARYLHQHLNDDVFRDIDAVMHNVQAVTRHLERKRQETGDDGFHTLRLIPTRQGAAFTRAASGPWRTYSFVEGTESFDSCRDPAQAYEAARAFGQFQARLIDLPPETLRDTIPDFFSSPRRLLQLEAAVRADPAGRVADVRAELDFVDRRRTEIRVIDKELSAGRIPRRVVHGDTKLNNVLFDQRTGKAVCVVDLDTCMPAYSLYDFGDLVRFTAATCAEDEQDVGLADTDVGLYRSLVEGYLSTAGGFLTPIERHLMPFAARLVTLTIGMRFLTDHIAGDVYFHVTRPDQNLDRARVQFAMVQAMEAREKEMRAT